jgi:hypothetical protein
MQHVTESPKSAWLMYAKSESMSRIMRGIQHPTINGLPRNVKITGRFGLPFCKAEIIRICLGTKASILRSWRKYKAAF